MMLLTLLLIGCSFLTSIAVLRYGVPLAVRHGLVDIPNNIRKIHKGSVPLVGGIAIYIGVLTSVMLFLPFSQNINLFLMSSALLLFVGVIDDKYELSVKIRMIFQVFAASIMIFGTENYIHSFGGILGGSFELGWLGIPVTVLAIVGAINAFNMMDGVDGLVGGESLITFGALSFLLADKSLEWHLLPIAFSGGIAAYLLSNLLGPNRLVKKVFMGDAGNMVIGLAIAWLLVIGTSSNISAFRPVTALYIVAIPLMDMASLILRRLASDVSPLSGDRRHVHHLLNLIGFSRGKSLTIIILTSFILAALGCVSNELNIDDRIMFFLFLIIFLSYHYLMSFLEKNSKIKI